MPRLRVTVFVLMLIVAVAALGFAAIRSHSDLWVGGFSLGTVTLLLVSAILARYGGRDRRPFWFGFALFGGVVYLHALLDPSASPRAIRNGRESPMTLALTQVVLGLVPHLRDPDVSVEEMEVHAENAVRITYLMVSLAVGFIGGAVAILVRDRRRRKLGGAKRTGRTAALSILIVALLGLLSMPRVVAALRPRAEYFPAGVFQLGEDSGESDADVYANNFHSMFEPSLLALARTDPDAAAYRFLAIPSFGYHSSIRVNRTADGATLRVVLLGEGQDSPAAAWTVTLGPDQWHELERQIDRLDFWVRPARVPEGDSLDGVSYLLEGVRGGRYHVVRWSNEDVPLREFLYGLARKNPRAAGR